MEAIAASQSLRRIKTSEFVKNVGAYLPNHSVSQPGRH